MILTHTPTKTPIDISSLFPLSFTMHENIYPTAHASTQHLATLKTHHKEIARLTLQGMKPQDIANTLELSYGRVTAILRDPAMLAHLDKLNNLADGEVVDIRKRIAQQLPTALDVLTRIMTKGEKESDQLKAAMDLLDRGGFSAVKRSAHLDLNSLLSDVDLDEVQRRMQAAEDGGFVVDVTPRTPSTEEDDPYDEISE